MNFLFYTPYLFLLSDFQFKNSILQSHFSLVRVFFNFNLKVVEDTELSENLLTRLSIKDTCVTQRGCFKLLSLGMKSFAFLTFSDMF